MAKDSSSALHGALIANLKSLMETRGENPTSLALKAGLNHRAVHDILQGRSLHPRSDTLRALAVALSAPFEVLLSTAPIPPTQNFGTGALGDLGQSADVLAAAYHAAPRILDGQTAYPAPSYLCGTEQSEKLLVQAPTPGFTPMVSPQSWILLDTTMRRIETPGLYWLSQNKKPLLAQLAPHFGDTTGLISVTLHQSGTQTARLGDLNIRGRVDAVLQGL